MDLFKTSAGQSTKSRVKTKARYETTCCFGVGRPRYYRHLQRMEQDQWPEKKSLLKVEVVIPVVDQGRDVVLMCDRTTEKEVLSVLTVKIRRGEEQPSHQIVSYQHPTIAIREKETQIH